MVQVSDTAAMAFRAFLDNEDGANVIRLELAAMPGDETATAIRFAAVEAPAEGDVQAEAPEVEIYVAPELSEPLSDAVIDAQMTPEGAELVIRRRDEADTAGRTDSDVRTEANSENGQNRGGGSQTQA